MRYRLSSWIGLPLLAINVLHMSGCSRPDPATPPVKVAKDDTATTDDAAATDGAGDATDGSAATDPSSDDGAAENVTAAAVTLGDPSLTAGIPGDGPLTVEQIQAWLDDPAHHAVLDVQLPLGLAAGQGEIKGLDENPLTRAKVELGRQLFFDGRLSSDGTVSCASCHQPEHGYAASTQFGVGVDEQTGDVNTPTAYNRILSDKQFWDGRAATLEEQAKGPIANPIEMANTHEQAVKTLQDNPGYLKQFEAIFPDDGVTIDNVAEAIAAFERTLVTAPAPFDYHERLRPYLDYSEEDLAEIQEDDPEDYARYEKFKAAAEAHPMSEGAVRGRELFFSTKAKCSACHVGANLTDEKYHNLGIGMEADQPKLGRYAQTEDDKDKGAFKTPTIRNVASTPPYMHDGSLATLEEVVEHYVKGGTANEWLSKDIVKLELTDQDKADLVEFMKACSSPLPEVQTERLPQ